MTVDENFVSSHFKAHREWSNTIVAGRIILENSFTQTPFGRFRHKLEATGVPTERGVVEIKNLCAAGNMSIGRERFLSIGEFDTNISSGEDQDLALRHTSNGGQIVYLPEAASIHQDNAFDIRSYCRRSEWGSEYVLKFCRKYPEWADNIEREKINGFIRLGNEPLKLSISKFVKSIISLKPFVSLMFSITSLFERLVPNSYLLPRLYSMLLGIHIFRGFRRALRKSPNVN
jgi:GT2 family glycosyltransferase